MLQEAEAGGGGGDDALDNEHAVDGICSDISTDRKETRPMNNKQRSKRTEMNNHLNQLP